MSFLFYLEAQYNSQCQPTVVGPNIIHSQFSSELQIEVDLVSSE